MPVIRICRCGELFKDLGTLKADARCIDCTIDQLLEERIGQLYRNCSVCGRDLDRDPWPYGGFNCGHCDDYSQASG